jgi:hypothetical protein
VIDTHKNIDFTKLLYRLLDQKFESFDGREISSNDQSLGSGAFNGLGHALCADFRRRRDVIDDDVGPLFGEGDSCCGPNSLWGNISGMRVQVEKNVIHGLNQ